MAEQQTEQQTNEQTTDTVVADNTPAKQAKQPKRHSADSSNKKSGNIIVWVSLLLSLVALAGLAGGYWLWLQQSQTLEQQQVQWREQRSNEQQQLNQQLGEQIKQLKTQQQAARSDVKDLVFARVEAMQAKVAEVSGRQPNDWVLAEANYLIRMAGRKLWLEHDLITAQHLMATADLRIAELNDASLFPLRQQISRDIATINALPNPLVSDIHLALSGLVKMTDQLPVNTIEIHASRLEEQRPPQPTEAASGYTETFLQSLKAFASRLLYVGKGVAGGDIEPLKMPKQQWFLRANVKMKLLQAQVAVLSRDQAVFRETVGRAVLWLNQFKASDANVLAMKTSLNDMLSYQIDAQYPERFASQTLMDQLLRERLGDAYQIRQAAGSATSATATTSTTPAVPAPVKAAEQAPESQTGGLGDAL